MSIVAGRFVNAVITDVVLPLQPLIMQRSSCLLLYETFKHNSQCVRVNSLDPAAIWTKNFCCLRFLKKQGTTIQMKQILSIQSAVTYGFVGNTVAAPVITKLGMQPLLVDTISLAAHPGYGTVAGGSADQTQFTAILEALTTLGILPQINCVMTGYLGDARQAGPIHSMIQDWQAERHDGLYILDPVLGDGGRLYVDTAIVDQIRQTLLPRAHIVTPNQFELGLLNESQINSVHDAIKAAKTMLQQHPHLQAVIATGIANTDHGISDLKVSRHNVTECDYAKRPHGVNGGGDLFTAILACWLTSGHDLNAAFAAASHDAHRIIDYSASSIDIALFDNLQRLTACC